jgi:hypothetical protein
MKKSLIVLIAIITAGCLFPVSQSLQGIIQTHKEFTLRGIVESYDALNMKKHIPADASLFVEFGVDSCLVAEFNRGNERYDVEIYSFLTPRGALGTYFITKLPGSQPFDLGYYARKSSKAVQFVKGHYVISVVPNQNGTIDGAFELASGFERRIQGGSIKPDLFLTLPKSNMVENSELYFTGHHGFERRFSVDLGKALNVEYALNGTAAQYVVGRAIVDFIRINFQGRSGTLEALDSYLKYRSDRPILHSQENLKYNTVVEEDRSEVYIAELGDVLYVMLGAAPDKRGQEFFEYVLRGGK